MDMDWVINRLHGTGRRIPRVDNRPPLDDILLAITKEKFNPSLGPRAVLKIQRAGHAIAGVRIVIVLFDGFLKAQERLARPAVSRNAQRVTACDLGRGGGQISGG